MHNDLQSLKVLTPQFAESLRIFNTAARELQRMHIRLHSLHPLENRLVIDSEDGRQLMALHLVNDCHQSGTAGTNHFTVTFQGVVLEWRESISYARPDSWEPITAVQHRGALQ